METIKRKKFSTTVTHNALVNCGRHCCLCGKFAGTKIELHHIERVDDNSADNCIPLCYDCHSEVKSFNPKHPKGKPYTAKELKAHRDKCYEKYGNIKRTINVKQTVGIKNNVLERLEKPLQTTLSWGFKALDDFAPIYKNSIILVAGYPSMGKSLFVQNIVRKNLKDKKAISYLSLKESDDEIEDNLVSGEATINVDTFNKRLLAVDDWKRLILGIESLNLDNLSFIKLDNEENTIDQILYLLKTQSNDLLVIDDINGLCLNDDGKQEFMYRLNDIIKQTNTTVIIVSNLERPENRKINKRPELSDFKTDELYRLCDIVAFTNIPEYEYWSSDYFDNKNTLEVIIAKSRKSNITGCVNLKFINNTTKLLEIFKDET